MFADESFVHHSSFMKLVPLVVLAAGAISFPLGPPAFAAVSDAAQLSEIATLEKKLSATRDELNAAKTALAIANNQTQAAEARARAFEQTDSQLMSMRSQIRILERDLQSATAALKRAAADKTGAGSAVAVPNQQLADATKEATPLRPAPRGPIPEVSRGTDQKIAELQSELSATRSRLVAAEKNFEARDAELTKLRATLVAAESRPAVSTPDAESARRAANEAQQRLASVTQELADARSQAAAARELELRVRQLEAEKATLLSRPTDPGVTKEEFARVATAQADAERKLAAAHDAYVILAKERDDLRTRASKAGELESRVRQLESAKASAPNATGDANVSKDELARAVAAQADAENKLSTALRAFTLLTKERDELRARLAEQSPKASAGQEKR